MVIQDEHDRKAVDENETIGDLCMGAVADMIRHNNESQSITVLSKGSIYYFELTCTGIRPPYSMKDPELGSGETVWFGQRAN